MFNKKPDQTLIDRAKAIRDHPWDSEHDVVTQARVAIRDLADLLVVSFGGESVARSANAVDPLDQETTEESADITAVDSSESD